MDHVKGYSSPSEEDMDLRRGPWTVEEDFTLINYIAHHGEGRWNSLARSAGLKRTGKSCRLRWLNYLRPDVRRGNISLEEQLLILELHSRWGNRWSKIAQHLPGRTDNEIKNYWRTRVQKHAKQLKCDVNSKQFKDTMRYLWMPRLVERIQAAAAATAGGAASSITTATGCTNYQLDHHNQNCNMDTIGSSLGQVMLASGYGSSNTNNMQINNNNNNNNQSSYISENSSTAASSDSFGAQVSPVSDLTDCYNYPVNNNNNQGNNNQDYFHHNQMAYGDNNNNNNNNYSLTSATGYFSQGLDFQAMDHQQHNNQWMDGGDQMSDHLWNVEDLWLLQQQFNNNII